jgi:hypothetical protein
LDVRSNAETLAIVGLVISFATFIVAAFIFAMCHEAIGEIRALRRLLKHDLRMHQDWLFEQLYSMAPGKVLKPDEEPEESADMPAYVYSPTEDAMAEFTGDRDDWR